MTVAAKTVRYIKLGRAGRWESVSLDQGELHFGHGNVPHELALTGDRKSIEACRVAHGRSRKAAASDARELSDFYALGSDCLWVTFAREHLWWTFVHPEVVWKGKGEGHGERLRKTIDGWRNTDVNGVPLRTATLSTRLTKLASYPRTLCAVEAEAYLLRRINGVIEPLVAKSSLAREALLDVMTEAISALHWRDFETLADVIFARSGWHRASELGGGQKLVDLVIEQPTTGDRGAVQIKSAAGQKELDEFIERADETGSFERLFFVCHTPRGALLAPIDRRDVHVWVGREIAKAALRLGLADWIIEKVS